VDPLIPLVGSPILAAAATWFVNRHMEPFRVRHAITLELGKQRAQALVSILKSLSMVLTTVQLVPHLQNNPSGPIVMSADDVVKVFRDCIRTVGDNMILVEPSAVKLVGELWMKLGPMFKQLEKKEPIPESEIADVRRVIAELQTVLPPLPRATSAKLAKAKKK
jgi:hypothetical protein